MGLLLRRRSERGRKRGMKGKKEGCDSTGVGEIRKARKKEKMN
jgi:hypothetical protein